MRLNGKAFSLAIFLWGPVRKHIKCTLGNAYVCGDIVEKVARYIIADPQGVRTLFI